MRKGAMAALAAGLMLCGCASVVRGTNEQVQFDSDPPGAEMRSIIEYPCGGPCPEPQERSGMYLSEEQMRTPQVPGPACMTPCAATVPRNQALIVTFRKPGYEEQTVKLATLVSSNGAVGMAGNVLVGGVVGAVVDTGTGAAMDHQPNPLKVTLRPVSNAAAAPAKKRKQ